MPTALTVRNTISGEKLKQAEETEQSLLYGMRKTDKKNLLLLADGANGSVKCVDVSNGEVNTLWRLEEHEREQGWKVSNVLQCTGVKEPVLLVAECKGNEWRVSTVKKSADESGENPIPPYQLLQREFIGKSLEVCRFFYKN